MSPHGRSLRVASCPPRGPLRLRPGKAGSAAPAWLKTFMLALHAASDHEGVYVPATFILLTKMEPTVLAP